MATPINADSHTQAQRLTAWGAAAAQQQTALLQSFRDVGAAAAADPGFWILLGLLVAVILLFPLGKRRARP